MRKSILLILFAIILISLCSCELSMEKPKQGKVHILVYGNDYSGTSSPLSYTVNDAVQVGRVLSKLSVKQNCEYETFFIYGSSLESIKYDKIITNDGINATIYHDLSWPFLQKMLAKLKDSSEEGDLVFTFFSGHGRSSITKQVPYGTDTSKKGVFCVSDTDVSVSDISDLIEDIPGTKVVFSDFCFSSSFVQAGYVSVTGNEYSSMDATKLFGLRSKICEKSSTFYLSASRYYQLSREHESIKHGYFTKALLEAFGWDEDKGELVLGKAYKDGKITFFDVANYIVNNDNESRQNPMFSGGSHDIILFSF